jgi:hypothetical protein
MECERNVRVATQSYARTVWGRLGGAYCVRGIVCNLVLYLLMEKGRFKKKDGEGYPIIILGFFPWFYLDFLAFICICLATAAEPGRARVLCLRRVLWLRFGGRWAPPTGPSLRASATSARCFPNSSPRSAMAKAGAIGGCGRCAGAARRSRRRGRDSGARR